MTTSSAPVTVVVTVKSVPVGGRHLRIADGALTREDVAHGIDPVDEVGVEWTVRAREAGAVGRVIAVTMGPPTAVDAVRRALAMGVDDAVHVTDPRLRGSDVRTTAAVLAAVVERSGAALAILGYESLDGSSGAVPAAVASLLRWPLLTRVRDAVVDGRRLEAELSTPTGTPVAEVDLPAVCSVVEGAVAPRYPTLQEVLRARQREVDQIGLADLGIARRAGARTERVVSVEPADRRRAQPVVLGPDEGIGAILDELAAVRGD